VASEQQQAEQQDSEEKQAQQQDSDQQDDRPLTEKPEVKEEHEEKAQEMRKEYVEQRPTVIMPGSGGTVAGTAVNEWLDDDGSPKFGDESDSAADESESQGVDRGKSDDKSYGDTVTEDKERNDRIRTAHDEAQADRTQNDEARDDAARGNDDEAQKDG
jgi:hypothetical protein